MLHLPPSLPSSLFSILYGVSPPLPSLPPMIYRCSTDIDPSPRWAAYRLCHFQPIRSLLGFFNTQYLVDYNNAFTLSKLSFYSEFRHEIYTDCWEFVDLSYYNSDVAVRQAFWALDRVFRVYYANPSPRKPRALFCRARWLKSVSIYMENNAARFELLTKVYVVENLLGVCYHVRE